MDAKQGWAYYESESVRQVAEQRGYTAAEALVLAPTDAMEVANLVRFTREWLMQVYGEVIPGDQLTPRQGTGINRSLSGGYVYLNAMQVNPLWAAVEPTWFIRDFRPGSPLDTYTFPVWFDTCREAKAYIEQIYAVSEVNDVVLLKARIFQLEVDEIPVFTD